MRRKVYANAMNGLAFPHDDVCMFLSTHGHSRKMGYFRMDAMPWGAVIELLRGRRILVVDATRSRKKELTDALRFGLTTWCLVFNRALRLRGVRVAEWQTRDMEEAAAEARWKPLVSRIRRLETVYGNAGAVRIGGRELVEVRCYRGCTWDDRPEMLREKVASPVA